MKHVLIIIILWILPAAIVSVLLILAVGIGGFYLGTQQKNGTPPPVISVVPTITQGCTEEAKICPDGTHVARRVISN